ICSNTMHRNFEQVPAAVSLPLLHIADATGDAVAAAGLKRVGLLGTRFTMEEGFYKGRLASQHGLDILIPGAADRERVHRVIYDELIHGELRPASREAYLAVIADLASRGAQGVILGCTEISLLVKPGEGPVPLFDTTAIHALRIVDWALADD
ncbi:MAG: amino acid racemase, partial [Candidatus Neomarinimicrobiota bacterium]